MGSLSGMDVERATQVRSDNGFFYLPILGKEKLFISEGYSGNINNTIITSDDENIYMFDSTDQVAYKINIKTKKYILKQSLSSTIPSLSNGDICGDNNYIYIASGGKIYQFSKIDLSLVTTSLSILGSIISGIATDGSFLYVNHTVDGTTKKTCKINISTMTIIFEQSSVFYGRICVDSDYMYTISSVSPYSILKTNKTSFSQVASYPIANGDKMFSMDGNYLYICNTSYKVSKLNISDLSLVSTYNSKSLVSFYDIYFKNGSGTIISKVSINSVLNYFIYSLNDEWGRIDLEMSSILDALNIISVSKNETIITHNKNSFNFYEKGHEIIGYREVQ